MPELDPKKPSTRAWVVLGTVCVLLLVIAPFFISPGAWQTMFANW